MDECIRCEDLERELSEANSKLDELENDVSEWESQYYDVDADADHYQEVAQNLVSLVRQISKEIPHIYMFLESNTFNEMKSWLEGDIE